MKEGKKEKQAISFSCKNQKFSERWVGKGRKGILMNDCLFVTIKEIEQKFFKN